jgi:hypothetical protein
MSVYVIAVPTTADAESMAIRYLFMQGQSQNIGGNAAANATALAAQLAVDPASLNLSDLNAITPEVRIVYQYVLRYDGTTWNIAGQQAIAGTRNKPVSVTGVTGLTSVAHDETLSGSGTIADPLAVVAPLVTFPVTGTGFAGNPITVSGVHQSFYGTGSPPPASGLVDGTLFFKYTP